LLGINFSMEIKNIIIILVIGFILFELIEHIAIPLIFSFKKRKRKSISGINGLLGEELNRYAVDHPRRAQ